MLDEPGLRSVSVPRDRAMPSRCGWPISRSRTLVRTDGAAGAKWVKERVGVPLLDASQAVCRPMCRRRGRHAAARPPTGNRHLPYRPRTRAASPDSSRDARRGRACARLRWSDRLLPRVHRHGAPSDSARGHAGYPRASSCRRHTTAPRHPRLVGIDQVRCAFLVHVDPQCRMIAHGVPTRPDDPDERA